MAKLRYEQEFKSKILRLNFEEDRIFINLVQEYKVNKTAISNWVKAYLEECQILKNSILALMLTIIF